VVFFGQNLDRGEVGCEAGALELAGLLFRVALGDEDEAMAGGQIGKSWGDIGQELDLLVSDGLGEAFDATMLLFGEGHVCKLLEAGDEGAAEAVQAVTMG